MHGAPDRVEGLNRGPVTSPIARCDSDRATLSVVEEDGPGSRLAAAVVWLESWTPLICSSLVLARSRRDQPAIH